MSERWWRAPDARAGFRRWVRAAALLAAFLATLASSAATQEVRYIYDELGRLVAVEAPDGERAEYEYDAAGNLIAVRRVAASALSISEITPNFGPVGTPVTLLGSGFSPTAADNRVLFGGTPAAVTAASARELHVIAPDGGSSGPIAVTVGASTATSSQVFTYTAFGTFGPPTIAGFTPDQGIVGTPVTITGANFDPEPSATSVIFGGNVSAPVLSVTFTEIVTTVPSGAGSGPLRVLTPRGTAVSSADFLVPPPGFATADVAARRRLALGESATLGIATANKHGLVLFEGMAGQYLSAQFTDVATVPAGRNVPYKVFDPNNLQIASGHVSNTARTIHLPRLTKSGTFSLFLSPGDATASLTFRIDEDARLLANGASGAVSTALASQTLRVTFTGGGGARLGLGLSGLVTTPAGQYVALYVYNPDGSNLSSSYCYQSSPGGGCNLNLWSTVQQGLPQSGTYSIVLTPPGTTTIAAGSLTLSSDVTGSLVAGIPFALGLARGGQNGRLSFAGTTGQGITLEMSDLLSVPVNQSVIFTLYRANNVVVKQVTGSSGSDGALLYIPSLPASETYTLFVDPYYAATATVNVSLDPGMDIVVDGPSLPVSTSTPGQSLRVTFAGTAGQKLGLGLSGLVTTPAGQYVALYVYNPDGSNLSSSYCYQSSPGGGCNLNLWSTVQQGLPQSGTYSIVLTPPGTTTIAAGSLTLSSDVTGSLVAGTPFALGLARGGQNGRLSFAGTTGQGITLEMSDLLSVPVNQSVIFTLYRANNVVVKQVTGSSGSDGALLYIPSLPASETYTLFVDPYYAATATVNVSLDPGMDIVVDGPSLPVSTSTPGQSLRVTFAGTAGQKLGLGLSGLVTTPAGQYVALYVYNPDGSNLSSSYCYQSSPGGGCNLNLWSTVQQGLPQSGTYSIVLTPPGTTTIAAGSLTLSSDVTGSLVAGIPFALGLARGGQNGRLSFAGTTGQGITLEMSDLLSVPVNQSVIFTLYRANNVVVKQVTGSSGSDGALLYIPSLPASETYTLFVDPYYAATATVNVSLDPGMDIVVDGPSLPVSTSTPGQSLRVTFAGTAGQKLGLGLSGLVTTPAGQYVALYVYNPDGSNLSSSYCYQSSPGGGCNLNLWSTVQQGLPQSGTYSIVLTPPGTTTIAAGSLTLSSDVTGSLVAGIPFALGLARGGQNGRLSFAGTTGQGITLEMSDLLSVPVNQSVIFTLYRANNVVVKQVTGSSGSDGALLYIPSLPASETYTLFVDPYYAATATVNVSLDPGMDIVVDGPSLPVSTSTPGQSLRVTFAGTAGQKLGLGLSGLVTTPAGQYVALYVYNPDGSNLSSSYCYQSSPGGGCNLNLWSTVQQGLPQSGTYSIVLTPPGTTTIAAGSLTLSSDVTGSLVAGIPFALGLARGGQNGRLSFAGTTGQGITLEMSDLLSVPVNQSVIFTLYRANNVVVKQVTGSSGSDGALLYIPSLPASETYTLFVDPYYAATATVNVSLDPGMDIVVDGPSLPVSTSTPGQSLRVTFAGTAGQKLGLGLSGLVTTPAGQYVALYVYNPDGSNLSSSYCYQSSPGGGCNLNLWSTVQQGLPQSGTYSIVLTPPGTTTIAAGSLTLSSDVTGSLVAGTPFALGLARGGQNGRLSFAGTTGQGITLEMSDLLSVPVNQSVIFTLYRANNVVVKQVTGSSGSDGALLYIPSLPASETYTLFVDPYYAATATVNVSLDPGMDIVVDGPSLPVSTSTPGQSLRVTFAGTAGQKLGLGLSGLVTTPAGQYVALYVYNPDGSNLSSSYCYQSSPGGGCNLNLWSTVQQGLPQSGTYSIVLTPPGTTTIAAGSLTLSRDLEGGLTIGAGPVGTNIERAGQNGRYTFSGAAGQLLRLSVAGLSTVPGGQSVTFAVYRPAGGSVAATGGSGPAFSYDVPTLPTSGNYLVFIDPGYAVTTTFSLSVSPR